ncbi:dUTPase-like protein [Dactylonectria estremocensis]|uniref:dUTPase-like protein n=1 Tax=Dactylonectria estremocensis TaxID=1079267 RepID=A0A9P9J580_9HYPO|nr:dUTPase-like protein [Dactylonectria estremocensis]
MMLSGASIDKRGIVRNLLSVIQQGQPCGVDLSLRRVFDWTSAATIDFDNSNHTEKGAVTLAQGAHHVEFNEIVNIPLDCMDQIFVRSSLWPLGALLTAEVIDARHEGSLGALLDVRNQNGVVLYRNAKLGHITLHSIYRLSKNTLERDGAPDSGLDAKN